jgi:hypothetical protein
MRADLDDAGAVQDDDEVGHAHRLFQQGVAGSSPLACSLLT